MIYRMSADNEVQTDVICTNLTSINRLYIDGMKINGSIKHILC